MKFLLLATVFSLSFTFSNAQQKDFEGTIYYKNQVSSKIEGIPDRVMGIFLALGDQTVTHIKGGDYRRSGSFTEEYYLYDKNRYYVKFRKIDTLYYLDYNSDSTVYLGSTMLPEKRTIAGYTCQSLLFRSSAGVRNVFYAPALYRNPVWDKNISLSNTNSLSKETKSVWLSTQDEAEHYTMEQTATRVEEKELQSELFLLPDLPQKKFAPGTAIKPPESKNWSKYLMLNVNTDLAAKYIKIPKGEKEARQMAMVSFIVSETGQIHHVKVLNTKDVHPKLAAEAARLVSESSGWKPATAYGEKIPFMLRQPISFVSVSQ